MFPFFVEPLGFSLGTVLDTPEAKSQLVGAWGVFWLFLLSALFNAFLGGELLFRGLLLPRMTGVFEKWDWVANGLLFSLYHLHQLGYLECCNRGRIDLLSTKPIFGYATNLPTTATPPCSWTGIMSAALFSKQSGGRESSPQLC